MMLFRTNDACVVAAAKDARHMVEDASEAIATDSEDASDGDALVAEAVGADDEADKKMQVASVYNMYFRRLCPADEELLGKNAVIKPEMLSYQHLSTFKRLSEMQGASGNC